MFEYCFLCMCFHCVIIFICVHVTVTSRVGCLDQMLLLSFLTLFLFIPDLLFFYRVPASLPRFRHLLTSPSIPFLPTTSTSSTSSPSSWQSTTFHSSLIFTFSLLLSSLIPTAPLYHFLFSFLSSHPLLFASPLFSIAQRKDLKVILMSATLNAELFSNYFRNEGEITCSHRH